MHESYRLSKWVGVGQEVGRDRKGKTGRMKEKDRGSLGTELLKLPGAVQSKAVSKQHLFHVGMQAGQKEEHTMLTSHSTSSTVYFTGAENNQPISNCQRPRKETIINCPGEENIQNNNQLVMRRPFIYSPILVIFGTF